MDHSYPMKTFNSNDSRTQKNDLESTNYDPVPTDQEYSIPRRPIQSRLQSDQVGLIHPAYRNPVSETRSTIVPSWLRWWLPEILASILSVASLLSIIIVLRVYNGRGLAELNLPASLTLNGIVAAIATITRVCLMVPVGSAMSQEAWLWFSASQQRGSARSRLIDLDLSDSASRGAWGSIVFLFFARGR